MHGKNYTNGEYRRLYVKIETYTRTGEDVSDVAASFETVEIGRTGAAKSHAKSSHFAEFRRLSQKIRK